MKNNQKEKKNSLFLVLAFFGIIGSVVGVTEKNIAMLIFYLLLSALFFYLWNTKKKPISESIQKEETISPKQEVTQQIPVAPKTKQNHNSVKAPTTNCITKNFRVAGVSYKQKEIEELASENPDYSLSKKDLCDIYSDGDTIYKYDFYISNVSLEPEPTNEFDANAVKVIVDGIHIGYIKDGKCTEVKNILNSGKKLSIDIEIHGGPYKMLSIDEDDVCTIEKDTDNFSAKVSITYNK